MREILSTPLEVAFASVRACIANQEFEGTLTVVVANELVEIDLSIHLLAVRVLEASPEDVSIVDTDVLS